MNLGNIIEKDLIAIASELGGKVITYRGEDYECIPSSKGTINSLEEGGFSIDADLSVTIRKSLFVDGVYPKSQEKIIYESKTYRVSTVRYDLTGTIVRLICVDDTRGI